MLPLFSLKKNLINSKKGFSGIKYNDKSEMLKKGKKATAKKRANNFVKFAMMVKSVPWQLCMSCCHASPLLPLTNFYNKKVSTFELMAGLWF